MSKYNLSLVGLHVPRCAGSSLGSALEKSFSPFRSYQTTSLLALYRYGVTDFTLRSDVSKKEIKSIWGHQTHEYLVKDRVSAGGDDGTFVYTCLRNPLDRQISHMAFARDMSEKLGKIFSEHEFVSLADNPVCYYLSDRFPSYINNYSSPFTMARDVVDSLDYVFIQEDLCEIEYFISLMSITDSQIPWINSSSEGYLRSIKSSTIDLMSEKVSEDIKLYNYVISKRRDHGVDLAISNCFSRSAKRIIDIKSDLNSYHRFIAKAMVDELMAYGVDPIDIHDAFSQVSHRNLLFFNEISRLLISR